MIAAILVSCVLVALTVTMHSIGFSLVLQWLMKSRSRLPTQIWSIARLLIRLMGMLIIIHAAEITVWGLSYLLLECLPDAESAIYFSGVSYTTIGYGDLVLPEPWRLLGPLEGLTGILMCGLSSGLFFAVVTRIYASRFKPGDKSKT